MAVHVDTSDLSELEREFELEMEDALDSDYELEEAIDEEFEAGEDEELSDDAEFEGRYDNDMERELSSISTSGDLAERLSELASREYESESDVDPVLREVLLEIEQDHFFKTLRRGISGLRKAAKGPLGQLVRKAVGRVAGQIPAVQALKGITSLARGNLQGFGSSLFKAGLGSVFPGGAAALDALKGLGFTQGQNDREAWNNAVDVMREAYEHLATHLNERADDPVEASRLATDAFRAGLAKVTRSARKSGAPGRTGAPRRRRRIRLRRGDVLIIECE